MTAVVKKADTSVLAVGLLFGKGQDWAHLRANHGRDMSNEPFSSSKVAYLALILLCKSAGCKKT